MLHIFLNIPIGIPIKRNPVNAYVPKQQFVFIKTRIVIRDSSGSVLLRGNAYVFVNYARSVHWDPATLRGSYGNRRLATRIGSANPTPMKYDIMFKNIIIILGIPASYNYLYVFCLF